MPRQIDLFPQNLQVNNDPTNRLGVTAAQINHLNDQIPAALAKAQSLAITNFLTLLDQETGLDLLGLWHDFQTSQVNIQNDASWITRLTNDLLITSDVFHLTYAAGSSSDTPTTLWSGGGIGNGKRTWYSAWNDLLSLAGVVNSTTAPTDAAPTTGAVIQANTATATTAGTNASIAIANASAVATTAQAITDGIFQSQNGGTSTGNATSTIVPSLTAIPASNIIGQTGATVAFGAVGGGNTVTGGGTSASWSHTIATGDLSVLVVIGYTIQPSTTPTSTVTYGGVAMTSLGRQISSVSNGLQCQVIEAWWLKSPASGSKTVAVSISSAGGVSGLAGNSVSYIASKLGAIGFNTGGGSPSLSMSAASQTGNMVVGAFTCTSQGSNVTMSSYSQTQRYLASFGLLVLGDAAGAGSVAFAVTASDANTARNEWCGVTVELSN